MKVLSAIRTAALMLFAGGLGIALSPSVLLAQETPDSEDAYGELIQAIASDEIGTKAFEVEFETIQDAWSQISEFSELEQECPGFIAGYASVMRDPMLKGQLDDYSWYRVQLDQLFRAELSEVEARDLTLLVKSQVGRKLMNWAWENQASGNVLKEVTDNPEGDVSREAFDADKQETKERLKGELSSEDLSTIGQILANSTAGQKLVSIQPKINDLTYEMFNRDYAPEIEAELDEVTDVFITSHLETCEIE